MTKQETRAFLAMHDALQTILMELTGGYNHDAVATLPYDQRHLDEAIEDGCMAVSLGSRVRTKGDKASL